MTKLKDMRDAYRIEFAPMSREQTSHFIMAIALDKRERSPFNATDGEMLGQRGHILWTRSQRPHKVQFSKGAGLVVCDASDTPGEVVLWAYTLHEMWKELNRMVTVGDIADTFPLGFPTKSATEKIWLKQKDSHHGNLIDDPAYWVLKEKSVDQPTR